MLLIAEFDAKTGLPITEYDPATDTRVQRHRKVEHSWLEQWLKAHGIFTTSLSFAEYNTNSLKPWDRSRLENIDKVLIFTSGKFGYFTDSKTAELIAQGTSSNLEIDNPIRPVFDFGQKSAHNLIAYGSLLASDGVSEASRKGNLKILVVDDEKRFVGEKPLTNIDGKPISSEVLNDLLDRMGDGTMLVPLNLAKSLMLDEEIIKGIARGLRNRSVIGSFESAGITVNAELSKEIFQEFKNTGIVSDKLIPQNAAKNINRTLNRIAKRNVVQFRAASSSLSGIAKGTASVSEICEKLGVCAIISINDIKGGDRRFTTPGIIDIQDFWMNRKAIAQHSRQEVGPQVKYKIPNSTNSFFNPLIERAAIALAEATVDPYRISARFVSNQQIQNQQSIKNNDEVDFDLNDTETVDSKDPLWHILKSDTYGLLATMPSVYRRTASTLRKNRLRAALSGAFIPSAMAQHHSKLMPWEICNKSLPHGAVVAYYRSPFPNAGAARVAINNNEVLRHGDQEAFGKNGVIYLNPWSAKQAITDFDGDRNGIFLGYTPNGDRDLIQILRNQLGTSGDPAEQYDRAIAMIEAMVKDGSLTPALHAPVVDEFIEINKPENRPIPIGKAPKQEHHWDRDRESVTSAIWRGWSITANNPVGLVAHQAMVLESLALQVLYIEPNEKPKLLETIAKAYSKIEPDSIPSDEYLGASELNLPPLNLANRVAEIVEFGKQVRGITTEEKKIKFAEEKLPLVFSLIDDYSQSAMARNLQTAVDIAKSNRGIDLKIQDFGKALAYQKHEMRADMRNKQVYATKPLANNTSEPVGYGVDVSNRYFEQSVGLARVNTREDLNAGVRGLIPKVNPTQAQSELVANTIQQYSRLTEKLREIEMRFAEGRREDLQPTTIVTTQTGYQFVIQRLSDADSGEEDALVNIKKGNLENVAIALNPKYNPQDKKGDKEKYILKYKWQDSNEFLGFIDASAFDDRKIDEVNELISKNSYAFLGNVAVELRVPYNSENRTDYIHEQMGRVLENFENQVPQDERYQYVSILWRSSLGMGIALKVFPNEIISYLGKPFRVQMGQVTDLGQSLKDGDRVDVRFDPIDMGENGVNKTVPAAFLISEDGRVQKLAEVYRDSLCPAPGTVVSAIVIKPLDNKIRLEFGGKTLGVKPADELNDVAISPAGGNFSLRREGSNIEVFRIDGDGEQLIGIFDKLSTEIINSSSDLQWQSGSTFIHGIYRREVHTAQMHLEPQQLIEHQPVAKILAGEILSPNKLGKIDSEEMVSIGEQLNNHEVDPGDTTSARYDAWNQAKLKDKFKELGLAPRKLKVAQMREVLYLIDSIREVGAKDLLPEIYRESGIEGLQSFVSQHVNTDVKEEAMPEANKETTIQFSPAPSSKDEVVKRFKAKSAPNSATPAVNFNSNGVRGDSHTPPAAARGISAPAPVSPVTMGHNSHDIWDDNSEDRREFSQVFDGEESSKSEEDFDMSFGNAFGRKTSEPISATPAARSPENTRHFSSEEGELVKRVIEALIAARDGKLSAVEVLTGVVANLKDEPIAINEQRSLLHHAKTNRQKSENPLVALGSKLLNALHKSIEALGQLIASKPNTVEDLIERYDAELKVAQGEENLAYSEFEKAKKNLTAAIGKREAIDRGLEKIKNSREIIERAYRDIRSAEASIQEANVGMFESDPTTIPAPAARFEDPKNLPQSQPGKAQRSIQQ